MSLQLALPKFPDKKWWANEFPNFASPVAFVSFLAGTVEEARWNIDLKETIKWYRSKVRFRSFCNILSFSSLISKELCSRVTCKCQKWFDFLNLTRWFYHKMWWIFWWHFDEAHVNSKSSLQEFKPFNRHFSSLPFHLPAALLGQITRVYFHQFKVMLDTAKRWKIDKYSNSANKMRHSKFSTVSPVLYNLPPAFQLCFHISTFQDNKKVAKSSRLRIPWSTQNWNLESKLTCWLQLPQNSHISK